MATDDKFSWRKWILILAVLVAVGSGGVWYFKRNRDPVPEYQTAPVLRGNLTQVVTATGQLGPVLTVQVGSQISGIVKKLYADFNSVVKSNQVVAEIDTSTYQVSVQKAEAQLANSKANLALAEVQARRASELFTNKLISASDQDTAHAQLQQAQAQVMSDDATLQNAKVQLSYCTIYAPVDGVVISRNVDVGQTVAASFNTPTVFLIANDLAKMQIDALVSEADIGGVATNQDVNFTVDAYPYRTFRGKVSQVRYGAVTNQSVISYDCIVGVSNPDLKLLPGMTANVSIIIAQRDEALKIPNAALRFRPPDVAVTNGGFQSMAQNQPPGGGERAGSGGGRQDGQGQGGPGRAGAGGGGRRGDGGPGGAPGAANRRPRSDRQVTRTVYVLPAKANPEDPESRKPKPVPIKVGISDGMMTEVLEGLEEGTQIVIGVITTGESMASRPGGPTANPFGGGGGFRRF